MLQYGKDFMQQLAPVYTGGETKHGGMITSCICHGCPWQNLELENKNSYQHYADWFYGKTTGAASMHIDTRNPNGDGTLTGDKFKQCAKFPTTATATEPDLTCKSATGGPMGPCPAGTDSCCDGPPGVGQSCYDSNQQDCCTTGPGKGHVCAKGKCSTRAGFICN